MDLKNEKQEVKTQRRVQIQNYKYICQKASCNFEQILQKKRKSKWTFLTQRTDSCCNLYTMWSPNDLIYPESFNKIGF